jgi:hypothetical protein
MPDRASTIFKACLLSTILSGSLVWWQLLLTGGWQPARLLVSYSWPLQHSNLGWWPSHGVSQFPRMNNQEDKAAVTGPLKSWPQRSHIITSPVFQQQSPHSLIQISEGECRLHLSMREVTKTF